MILPKGCSLRWVNILSLALVSMLLNIRNTTAWASALHACERKPRPSDEWRTLPEDVCLVEGQQKATQAAWQDFAYRTFIALNWPALLQERGAVDGGKSLGATGEDHLPLSAVWQSYKSPEEIFLNDGVKPQDWNASPPNSACASSEVTKTLHHINQPAFFGRPRGALVDRNKEYVYYETFINKEEFDYIMKHKYYDSREQKKAQSVGGVPKFPWGSLQVKAAWRQLDPATDIMDRYFRMQAWTKDANDKCQSATFGLVGLHIARLTRLSSETWFWTTFEHVDNVETELQLLRPDGTLLTPSFNPGLNGEPKPPYEVGYFVKGEQGAVNPQIAPNQKPLRKEQRLPVFVSRFHNGKESATAASEWYRSHDPIKGTVWENYRLTGSMVNTLYVSDPEEKCAVADQLETEFSNCHLTNAVLETFNQDKNCLHCHEHAQPLCAANSQNSVLSFILRRAQPDLNECPR